MDGADLNLVVHWHNKKKLMNIILIAAAVLIVIVFLVRSRIAPSYSVAANEISAVISQLQQSAANGHFAVLMFVPPGSTDDEAINLQYSIDGGVVGLDWVLISPRNVADKTKVSEFASRLGYRLEEKEMNNVRFLRITGSGISELGIRIIRELYLIDPNTKLSMITDGFNWRPPAPKSQVQ